MVLCDGQVRPGHYSRRVTGRIVAGIDVAAPGDRGGIGSRGRSRSRNIHRDRNRRVAGSCGQHIAPLAFDRLALNYTSPAGPAGRGRYEWQSHGVTYNHETVGGRRSLVTHRNVVSGACLSLGKATGMGFGEGQVGARSYGSHVVAFVVVRVDVPAAGSPHRVVD